MFWTFGGGIQCCDLTALCSQRPGTWNNYWELKKNNFCKDLLENWFAMLKSFQKHHKSKVQIIPRRSYIGGKISTPKKKYVFFSLEKILEKKTNIFWTKNKKLKNQKFPMKNHMVFSLKIFEIVGFSKIVRFFFSNFFWTRKKTFRSWEKFLGYSFDVKFAPLSIYDVF